MNGNDKNIIVEIDIHTLSYIVASLQQMEALFEKGADYFPELKQTFQAHKNNCFEFVNIVRMKKSETP